MRRVLEDSFIVTRDEQGEIRAHFNMCLHRGMQVCRAEMGNASHFRCPYHGWSYRNDGRIVGLPFHQDAYGGEAGFKRKGQRLLPAPNLATYNGMIFVSMDPDAPPLEEFLGDFRFYLDYYTKQSGSGIELRGPQRWRVKANWKIGAENFAGDMYHTPQTHTSVVEIGLFREPKAEKRKDGATYWAGAGGGTTYKLPPGDLDERMRYVGYPQEMVERMKEHWSSDQLKLIGDDGFMISAASIYPNLSFVHNWPRVADSEDVLPFISIRQWQPISEDETEVLSWFAVDAEAPEEFKALSYKAYLMCFGSTGMFEQDDVENWVSLTNTAAGLDGPPAATQQPDGHPRGRHRGDSAAHPGAVPRSGLGAHRLLRVQPARPAEPLGRRPGEADGHGGHARGRGEPGGRGWRRHERVRDSRPTPPVPSSAGTPPASSGSGRACPSATSGT